MEAFNNLTAADSPATLVGEGPPSNPSPIPTTHHGPQRGAAQAAALHHLNPRSCVTCRKRKVRCDKRNPCANCTKAHIECIFPAPGRAPRKPRKPPDSELLARLRKLEGVVKSLGGSCDVVDDADVQSTSTGAGAQANSQSPPWGNADSFTEGNWSTGDSQARHNAQADWAADHHRTSLDTNFGRLVLNEGRSRYINNSFWANLSNEVEDLKGILHSSSDDEDEDVSPNTSTPGSPIHQGFMFGHGSPSKDLHRQHPPPHLFQEYWRIFEGHVSPLIKMFHVPTMRAQMKLIKADPASCSKGNEALLFAIYYGAITSMSPEDCKTLTGEPRNVLLSRYRHATEQALARAHFLVTEEMVVLQALIMFLLSLRLHEDPRHIWSLTGLVVRIAVTMGLHRDGTHFDLPPFDVEMRRRLWWQVCILDFRTSEDHGCDPSILEHTFDTKLPLNVNDEDITPTMTEPPTPRTGVTEMTFCLIRFEVTNTFRRLNYFPPGSERTPEHTLEVTIQDKERWIEECHQRLEDMYLQYCDMSNPMHWVICTVARLVMAKMWLQIYQPYQRLDAGASLPQGTRDRLFITSLESIEYHLLLASESRTVKWGWLFKTYSQWHALAFLLSELCHRTKGPTTLRAWLAIDATIASWGPRLGRNPKHQMWRPLGKLLAKARAARERELALDNTRWEDQYPNTKSQSNTEEDEPEFGLSPLVPTRSVTMTDDRTATTRDTSLASPSFSDPQATLSLPLLHPNASVPGAPNFIPNTTTNPSTNPMDKPFATSPFFANQPQIQPSQWSTAFDATELPCTFMNDLLMPDDVFNTSTTSFKHPAPFNLDPASIAAPLPNGGHPSTSSKYEPDTGAASNQPTLMKTPSFSLLPHQTQPQPQPQPLQIPAANPLLNYADPADLDDPSAAVQWEDWDDMVRNFELETGEANGVMGAGMRRPMTGVPWFD